MGKLKRTIWSLVLAFSLIVGSVTIPTVKSEAAEAAQIPSEAGLYFRNFERIEEGETDEGKVKRDTNGNPVETNGEEAEAAFNSLKDGISQTFFDQNGVNNVFWLDYVKELLFTAVLRHDK